MDIGKLPTDSLYKFQAVGGLLLCALCLVLSVQLVISQNKISSTLNVDVGIYNAANDPFEGRNDFSDEELPIVVELNKTRAALLARNENAMDSKEWTIWSLFVLSGTFFSSILFSFEAFSKWQKRIQVHQDSILRLEGLKAKVEADKLETSSKDS